MIETTTGDSFSVLGAHELRRVVAVLSTVQIVSWGMLYYTFAALQGAIIADTGWSSVTIAGAFSVSQLVAAGVGIWVGRHVDEFGPRYVMTAASLIAVPGITAVALATNLIVFYLGWALTGVAMAGTLYPPAFTALTRWGGQRRVRSLTTLTLVAGLASTVFSPLASGLETWLGWRTTYLVLLASLVVVTVPLHWWGLNHPWRTTTRPRAATGDDTLHPAKRSGVASTRAFVLLTTANACAALAIYAVVINLVPMLVEQGMSRNLAAITLGLGGIGQIVGRLGYARFADATSATTRSATVLAAVAAATAALALAARSVGLLICFAMVVGLARGLYTLVQATAITDRWGPSAYGKLNGILTAPALTASAVAPFAGAALADLSGSYANAFLILAVVASISALLMLETAPDTAPDTAS